MKKTNYLFLLLIFSFFTVCSLKAQDQPGVDSTGLPGDNFSLQGALEMFQKANSPEEFEKMLNSPDNHVNNLDLNGDGEIDYIRVIDNSENSAHAFVLQAVISENESQDIAVIELEKTGDTTAMLQIVGDEDIYGEKVIVEPDAGKEDGTFNNYELNDYAVRGPNAEYDHQVPAVIVNVWFWPCVRFVYVPTYVAWRSPWRWHHYPGWWNPWRPFAWHVWHPFHYMYYRHFAVVPVHRVLIAHRIYTPIRVTSVTVRTRNQVAVNNYRVTRTKTTVTGPRGNKFTKTTTTVRGPRGKTREKTNRIKVRRKR